MKENTHLKRMGNLTSLLPGLKIVRPQVQNVRFSTPDGRIVLVRRLVGVQLPQSSMGSPAISPMKCSVGNQVVTANNRSELERKAGEALQKEITRRLAANSAGSGIKMRS